MEQEMDDGMFWLPTEFLTDDDVLVDFKSGRNKGTSTMYGPDSDLSSPVESVMGSTETESDEEDYLNELSRKLAQSTLEDNYWKTENSSGLESHHSKSTSVMSGSPQSTLCGCKQTTSSRSTNRLSPAPPVTHTETAWDLLYAAAGEVARLRMADSNRNHIAPQAPRRIPSPNFQLQQLQAAQQLKQQQHQHQQQHYQQFIPPTRGRTSGGNMKPAALPLSAWPTLQQSQQQLPPGSGMRAVFLGNPTTKRECTGTGVFLPRQIGAPAEPPKKRAGCSTVLLPERVLHALNLNLEAQNGSNGGRPCYDYDAEMRHRRSVLVAEQQRRRQVEKDLRLPHEWTY
ncbi:uncharacterized protein LOC111879402 isoform X1 [Lactuca sativa]|uniref:Uncharacterized protein n=1 Tax=Lactuca sativa TaxID=4236 RepID=A0A9R1WPK0_LACSA|nr:uncharacterized protein LOC111879402 isoform X1 [Lactuca sativa]KAJ0185001.1 hypothetical protein LSAT_V11C900467470 [Lactuca sativa]